MRALVDAREPEQKPSRDKLPSMGCLRSRENIFPPIVEGLEPSDYRPTTIANVSGTEGCVELNGAFDEVNT